MKIRDVDANWVSRLLTLMRLESIKYDSSFHRAESLYINTGLPLDQLYKDYNLAGLKGLSIVSLC